jgi:hypothetical protein
MFSRKPLYLLLLVFIVVAIKLYRGPGSIPATQADGSGRYSAAVFLRGSDRDDFKKVIDAHDFSFPQDHGAHNDYRSEWWYFTGNL